MNNIFDVNERDIKGLIGWFLVSIIVGILALPVMVGREIYQWKHYSLPNFEWEDIIRYSVVIILGSLVNYGLLTIFNFI